MSRYAVFDIETTGFSPALNHRIVEVAVVLVDDDGNTLCEWDTLVNPKRDVSATEVHGLSASDLYQLRHLTRSRVSWYRCSGDAF